MNVRTGGRRAAAARRIMPIVCATAAIAMAIATPLTAHANDAPTRIPENLRVPDGHRRFLDLHATGTQNYMCLPSGSSVAWLPVGPQATLFNDLGNQVTTHFLSVNPYEFIPTARPTWQHSRDTSAVWAMVAASSTDPAFVTPGAIPWLLLTIVGTQEGPTGGDALTATTYIQRINTVAGSAPATGCAAAGDIGKRVFVPYETDYVFYKART